MRTSCIDTPTVQVTFLINNNPLHFAFEDHELIADMVIVISMDTIQLNKCILNWYVV